MHCIIYTELASFKCHHFDFGKNLPAKTETPFNIVNPEENSINFLKRKT